jgi:hypothetical protein
VLEGGVSNSLLGCFLSALQCSFVALVKGVDSDTDFATLRHLIPELLPHCQHALVVGWGKT